MSKNILKKKIDDLLSHWPAILQSLCMSEKKMFMSKDTEMSGLICLHRLIQTTTERNNSLE